MIIENGTWTVYIHINKTTNKPYVGITSEKNPANRWGSNGINYRGCQKFWHAIKKYGWDNFGHQIFASNLTQEEASNMEMVLIKKLDSINNGYNIEPGGINQGPRSPEARQKLREARLRQVITPEQYEKGAAKRRGKKFSEERKVNLKRALRASMGVSVICIETGKWYDSASAAQEDTGVNFSNVLASAKRHAQGSIPHKRGLHWKYACKKPDGYPGTGVDSSESKRHTSNLDEDIA